jgi:fermentation-respiration switch protein FrsA (DUF1100 family)
MGGAAAAIAGAELKADAVVLESTYSTMVQATGNRVAARLGPLAPIVTPLLLVQLRPRLGVGPDALRPAAKIRALGCPVLVLSGDRDPYTTPQEARRLFLNAARPKEIWLVPNAGHEDLLRRDRTGYREHVLRFLARYLDGRRTGAVWPQDGMSVAAAALL